MYEKLKASCQFGTIKDAVLRIWYNDGIIQIREYMGNRENCLWKSLKLHNIVIFYITNLGRHIQHLLGVEVFMSTAM